MTALNMTGGPIPFVMTRAHVDDVAALARLAVQPDRLISRQEMAVAARGFDPDDPSTRFYLPVPQDQTLDMPFGWRLSLSVEEQPFGRAMHLSVSAPAVGELPSPDVMAAVMRFAGFRNSFEDLIRADLFYLERYEKRGAGLNVLEPLDVELSDLKRPDESE